MKHMYFTVAFSNNIAQMFVRKEKRALKNKVAVLLNMRNQVVVDRRVYISRECWRCYSDILLCVWPTVIGTLLPHMSSVWTREVHHELK